jgi:hypothetical protein
MRPYAVQDRGVILFENSADCWKAQARLSIHPIVCLLPCPSHKTKAAFAKHFVYFYVVLLSNVADDDARVWQGLSQGEAGF